MASRSLPIPIPQTQKQAGSGIIARTPSVRSVALVCIVLLILLLWLHFFIAIDITSTGREIQAKSEQLRRLGRDNAALREWIAESASQENLANKAKELGYSPQAPIYLPISLPLPGKPGHSAPDIPGTTAAATAAPRQAPWWGLETRVLDALGTTEEGR